MSGFSDLNAPWRCPVSGGPSEELRLVCFCVPLPCPRGGRGGGTYGAVARRDQLLPSLGSVFGPGGRHETRWYRPGGRTRTDAQRAGGPVGTDRGRPQGLGGEDGRWGGTGRTSWHRPRGAGTRLEPGTFLHLGGMDRGTGRPTDRTGLRPVATVPTRRDQLAPCAEGGEGRDLRPGRGGRETSWSWAMARPRPAGPQTDQLAPPLGGGGGSWWSVVKARRPVATVRRGRGQEGGRGPNGDGPVGTAREGGGGARVGAPVRTRG